MLRLKENVDFEELRKYGLSLVKNGLRLKDVLVNIMLQMVGG